VDSNTEAGERWIQTQRQWKGGLKPQRQRKGGGDGEGVLGNINTNINTTCAVIVSSVTHQYVAKSQTQRQIP